MLSFQKLHSYVGENQDKFSPILAEEWATNPPTNRSELDSILSRALKAFPLPEPDDVTPSETEPFTGVLRENLKLTQDLVRELNGLADLLRNETPRDDAAVSAFLGKAQMLISPDSIEEAIVLVFGNFLDAVWFVRGREIRSRKKKKLQEKFRLSIREDYQNRLNARRRVRAKSEWFMKVISKLPNP